MTRNSPTRHRKGCNAELIGRIVGLKASNSCLDKSGRQGLKVLRGFFFSRNSFFVCLRKAKHKKETSSNTHSNQGEL